MAVWKLLRPILNVTGVTKKLQKLFEKTVADNQAAGLSANSAYNAAKREVMETLKKIKVTKTTDVNPFKQTRRNVHRWKRNVKWPTKEDKKRVLEALRKEKITKKAEGGEIVFGKNVDKDLL